MHYTLTTKLFMFDFDGTIVDSMDAFAAIAARAINKYYGTPLDLARRQYVETSGLPFCQQLQLLYPSDPRNLAAESAFETEKKRGYFEQQVYPDALPTLRKLKERGRLTAVTSNNFQELVEEYIAQKGLTFDIVLGFRPPDFTKGSPHFNAILAQTGFSRNDLLFVGDSLKDAERAKEFGIAFVAKTGFFSRTDFTRKYPEVPVIDRLQELVEDTSHSST